MMLVFAIAVALAAFYYTLFIRDRDIPDPLPVSPVQHLEDRKQAIYENLRDLQFEFRLGKISDEDYQQTKLALQRDLASVLAEISSAGAVRLTTPIAPRPSGTRCPNCGASFPQKLKFCGECGQAIT
jgi:hypothetical protein